MTLTQRLLDERKLPPLRSREEMKQILLEKEYGFLPDTPYSVTVSDPVVLEKRFACGTVILSRVEFTVTTALGSHTFPVHRLLHTDGKKRPFFVFLNFETPVPTKYYPVEEISEGECDVLSVCYKDVTSDDGDFSDGLAGILLPHGQESDTTCGKLMLWAFAASRILDYAGTLPGLDLSRAAVMGHSRLGKTALIAGMTDERFRYAFSNDSGCSGAALSKGNSGVVRVPGEYGKYGETIGDIVGRFPYWFCKNFFQYTDAGYAPDFDQHYLIAAIAPRYAYVASADMDDWADPNSEFLACHAASGAWEAAGLPGFTALTDRFPNAGEVFHAGSVGYHKRHGLHFLSRYDWARYMEFISAHP